MSSAAPQRRTESPREASSWPPDVSHAGTMTIGAVLTMLQAEFPAVTISKIRFLEDQGLVAPSRTGSGYRKFSQADVARLRYTLAQQRDHYLPLRVIREQLDALDSGQDVEEHRTARVVASEGRLVLPVGGARVSARELADLTGASAAEIEEMTRAGILVADERGRYAAPTVSLVPLVLQLSRLGLAPRHLRSMRSNADNVADLIDQVVAPGRARRTAVARERSAAEAGEIAEVAAQLYAGLLRAAVENLDD